MPEPIDNPITTMFTFQLNNTKRKKSPTPHGAEVCFASFLSGGFTTMAVMNPPEKRLKKHTSLHCPNVSCRYIRAMTSNVDDVRG